MDTDPYFSPDIQMNSRFKYKNLDHMSTNLECKYQGILGIKKALWRWNWKL